MAKNRTHYYRVTIDIKAITTSNAMQNILVVWFKWMKKNLELEFKQLKVTKLEVEDRTDEKRSKKG